ncbi:hypothetical protein IOD16_20710 [Saccharothrix sp. 6-C]|uniref:hypothetical protein n=1 Tax=Saccharothrix sp. 6-C TaxID=2781735 RepID=UPI00191771FB|nr:hypothetical protein [Saccharothrix sp. 6-C]QQQ73690.1 hypothetical protein IOD16_20710 [Saccharothrix sp. 6-C]
MPHLDRALGVAVPGTDLTLSEVVLRPSSRRHHGVLVGCLVGVYSWFDHRAML